MPTKEKQLQWVGSSHKDLMALSMDVRRSFGFALSLAQAGDRHDAAKVLKRLAVLAYLKWWKMMREALTAPSTP